MDGTYSFGAKVTCEFPDAIAAYSVDTMEDARAFRTLFCRKQYDGRYVYFGDEFDGTIDGLFKVGDRMAEWGGKL